MFELKKYRTVMFYGTVVDAKVEGKLTSAFKNYMRNLANFHRPKNNEFSLEGKMVELNRNKNLKQLDRRDAVRKLCFALKINEQHN